MALLMSCWFRLIGRCRCGGTYSTHRERWPHEVELLVATCRRCKRTKYR